MTEKQEEFLKALKNYIQEVVRDSSTDSDDSQFGSEVIRQERRLDLRFEELMQELQENGDVR